MNSMTNISCKMLATRRLPPWPVILSVVVALYTAYPFLSGVSPLNADVPGDDAEWLVYITFQRTWQPQRYYGQYLYFLLHPQLYYYLTPAISAIPAVFMGAQRWFVVWAVVLLGGFGYTRHMLMGSFLPIINYMVFIPLNLWLMEKGRYRWLVAAMFVSLMFHGSSGIIIQVGTFLCMATRLTLRDWLRVAPLAVPAAGIYLLNHQLAPSIAAQVLTNLEGGNPNYANYLEVIRGNGMLGRTDLLDYLPVNWYFYYLGLPLFPALFFIALRWRENQYIRWLARFTALPVGVIIAWTLLVDIRTYTFDILDRASNALSIILFMAAGLACAELLNRPKQSSS